MDFAFWRGKEKSNFITEFRFSPDSSKEGVPLVTGTSQGDGNMGVFEDM
jgi:hypothetical protein